MIKELSSAQYDLYIDQGDSYYKSFTVRDNSGTIVNLTGMTMSVEMRRYTNTGTVYNLVGTVSNAAGGVFNLTMAATDSALLKSNRYVYAVKLTDGTDTTKIMHGTVVVTNI